MVNPAAIRETRAELLRAVADDLGSAYVYDLDSIRAHAHQLRDAFAPATVYYAVKANPLSEVVLALNDVLDGVEVASTGELHYVRDLGIPPERILFGGPVRARHDLDEAVGVGVRAIHLDSLVELDVARSALARSSSTLLAVRVNTTTGVDAPFDNMVGGSSRFGVDEELLIDLSRRGLLDGV